MQLKRRASPTRPALAATATSATSPCSSAATSTTAVVTQPHLPPYREIEGVTQVNRDYSRVSCAWQPVLPWFIDQRIGFDHPSCLRTASLRLLTSLTAVEGNTLADGRGPGFNFAAPSYFQRPDERVIVGTFAHYDINEHVEAYTELMFMDTKSTTQFGPAGNFFLNQDVGCANPLMSDQQRAVLGCLPGVETVPVTIGRRNVEGGPRFGVLRHSTYRGVFGVRGDINDTWRYDVSWQYAEVDMRNRGGNYFDTGRFGQALRAVPGPDGTAVCSADADPGCVPYDLWNSGGVTG